ncbi:MAG: C40 family peptidase [Burkholderiales bacterium]
MSQRRNPSTTRRRIVALPLVALLPTVRPVQAQAPADTSASPDAPPSFTSRAGELLFRAMALLGTRYSRGGRSPETGFDCSGFVGYLFREVMNLTLPRSAHEIVRLGEEVDAHSLEPGDLVFYNTLRRPFSHVGIFIGDGKFIHAPASGGAVRTERMDERYWRTRWNGARRIGT